AGIFNLIKNEVRGSGMDNERRCKSTRAQLSLLISTRVCRPYISHFDNIKSRFHPPLAAALRGEVLTVWTVRNRATPKAQAHAQTKYGRVGRSFSADVMKRESRLHPPLAAA